MRVQVVQSIVDILRFKYLKKYLNNNPMVLKMLINFWGIFDERGNILKVKLLKYCGASIGKNVKIGNNIHIYRPKNLEMEDFSSIPDNTVLICWNKVHIGKYTFLAVGNTFIPGSHRTDNFENLENQEILIGKGCWIGANCTIMGGTKIGNGSIVGAGSVLTGKEYPPFSIIAGVPAKIIKQRIPSAIINIPTTYNIEELYDA